MVPVSGLSRGLDYSAQTLAWPMDGTFVADVAVVVAAAVDFAVAAVVVETGGKDLQIGTCMDRKKIQTEMYQIDCFPFQLFQVRK